jgi:excisionase family DNA binding protein
MQVEEPTVGRMLLRVPEAARAIGVATSTAYVLIQAGTIPSVRLGGSVRVPVAALQEWIASQARARV